MSPRPGRRGPADGRRVAGTTGDEHQVWLEIGNFKHSLFLHPEGDTGPDGSPLTAERGPSLIYRAMGARGSLVGVDLTNLTHEELVAFRELWQIAFTLAEPVVLLRDKEAQDEFSRGNDSFTRVHRAVPRLVVRARAQRAYRQVVHRGLEDVLAGGWDLLRSLVRPGGDGDAVASVEADNARTQDDDTAADEPQGVRSVDG